LKNISDSESHNKANAPDHATRCREIARTASKWREAGDYDVMYRMTVRIGLSLDLL
jgi:hypothetical protein